MSFPKITDINAEIDISLEEAFSLLLTSIALQEESLSNLLNVETNKLVYILEETNLERFSNQDILDINKSINKTVTNVIRLQTLLQLKMDDIISFLPVSFIDHDTSVNSLKSTAEKGQTEVLQKSKNYISKQFKKTSKKHLYSRTSKKENTDDEKMLLYLILLMFLRAQ